jgi:hypothetical protein
VQETTIPKTLGGNMYKEEQAIGMEVLRETTKSPRKWSKSMHGDEDRRAGRGNECCAGTINTRTSQQDRRS